MVLEFRPQEILSKMHCELDLGSVESQGAPEEGSSAGIVHCAASPCAFSHGVGETSETALDQIPGEGAMCVLPQRRAFWSDLTYLTYDSSP